MSRLISRTLKSVVLGIALLGLAASAAFAHGETVKTDPKKNASLDAAPQVVSVDLSEPPTGGALFKVTDGCDRNVASHVTVEGNKLIAHLEAGQPGKWKAAYQIVSAADGHPSDGDWSFTVEGDADCDEGDESPTESPPSSESPSGGSGDVSEPNDEARVAGTPASDSEDGGFPVIPIVAGAIAVLGAAAFVRAKTG